MEMIVTIIANIGLVLVGAFIGYDIAKSEKHYDDVNNEPEPITKKEKEWDTAKYMMEGR